MEKAIILFGLLLLGGLIATPVHAVEVTGATPGYIVITNNQTNLTFRVPVAILSERNLNSSFYEKAKSLTKSSKPLLTLSYPFNNTKNYNNSVPIVGQALSVNKINYIKYSLDNGSWISIHPQKKGDIYEFNTTIFAGKGSHILKIEAIDSKNHVSSLEVNFEVAITKGRWAFYRVPWSIYGGGTFYTQTGYKIVIKNDWSYSDYLSIPKFPSIYVYSPDGKLYAQLVDSITKAVKGKLVWSYKAGKSTASTTDWCFWEYKWMMTPSRVGPADPGSGFLQLNNVRIYLYETQKAGANWKQTYKVDNFEAESFNTNYEDLFTAVRLYNGPNLKLSDGTCGFLNIENPYLPGDYTPPEIFGAGYNVYLKATKYLHYYNGWYRTYTYYPPVKSNVKLIKFNYISNKTGLNIGVHDDDANPIIAKQITQNAGSFGLNTNELKRYLYNATPTPNLKVEVNGKLTTPVDDYFVLSDYPNAYGNTYTLSTITSPNKVYNINPSTAGLIPNQENTVVVKATDAAGRVTTKNINVYYDNKPPSIAVSPYKKTTIPILVYDNGKYGIGPWGTRVNGWPDSTAGWIWTQKSTSAAPPGSVTLMKSFTLNESGTFTFYTTADNSFTLSIDSKNILSGNNWQKAYKTTYSLSVGTHTIKIIATNAGTSPNPAGVLFAMYDSTGKLILQSDGTWNHGYTVATLFDGFVTLDVSDISGVRAINVTTTPYGTIIYGGNSYTMSKNNPWASILTHEITDTNQIGRASCRERV